MTGRARKPIEHLGIERNSISHPRHFARVIGVDMSLTSTGIVTLYRVAGLVPKIETVEYRIKVPNDATLDARRHRIVHTVQAIRNTLGTADLLIIEGPSHGSAGGHAWDRAGAWWQIVDLALAMGCPVAIIAPSTRAKWATGNGRADKAAVAAAMSRRMPDVVFNNSDEADAAALAWMGAQRLGWQPGTKAELAALEVVKWPKGVHA